MFWLPANLDLFVAGMGLAVLSAWMQHRAVEPQTVTGRWIAIGSWSVALLAFWTVSNLGGLAKGVATARVTTNQLLYHHVCFGIVALALVTPAVVGAWSGGWIRRFLASPVMRYLGLVSYGIYLWHQYIQNWVMNALGGQATESATVYWSVWNPPFPVFVAIVLTLATAVSSLSYFLVERPTLRRARRHVGSAL